MKKYTYEITYLSTRSSKKDETVFLNSFGRDGWELVSVNHIPSECVKEYYWRKEI